ncbi:MAG: efflux RND transporter periplasmic adaptor subunit [Planctomycetes bacterium]|nr:efflux RND transporter periplasmic adaptor subunit [Planctomycetota bacterium]
MASTSAPPPSQQTGTPDPFADKLAKLRIKRPDPPAATSWFSRLLRFLVVVLVVAGIAGGGLVLAARNQWITLGTNWTQMPEIMQSRPEVRPATVTVETGRSGDATVVATGYLKSRFQAKIGAKSPGRVAEINVEEGSKVVAGQILAILEHADLEASLAAVTATLARAKATLREHEVVIQQLQREHERAEKLFRSKQSAESNYDEAKFKYEGALAKRETLVAEISLADARRREAEQMKENMFIRAPFDGTVVSKDAELGESILPGGMGKASGRGSAVTVADLNHLEVECDVKEDYISRVVPDQNCEVAVDAVPKERFEGRVHKVIPMGNRARATIKVKVEIVKPDPRLFPDMSATVYFLPADSAAAEEIATKRVFCDSDAIVSDSTGSFVWIVDASEALQKQPVTVGAVRDSRSEITSGLQGGERVVIAPPEATVGQRVKIAR